MIDAAVVVRTTHGPIAGEPIDEGFRFLGVPYAKPPLGPRRFRPPVSPDPWTEALPCRERRAQGEDALYLNVWTPSIGAGGCPVMFWTSTPRAYDGRRFARDGVVLVTASTRWPPFSTLCVEALRADGASNLVLVDQIAVLEWIHDNIARFSGDPDRVTVFGASHGGRSASSLMVAPKTRGLIRRAVVMSPPRSSLMGMDEARATSLGILDQLGVGPSSLTGLGEVPAERIVAAAEAVVGRENFSELTFTVDGVVLPDDPLLLAARGAAAGIDLLTGYTADEARYRLPSSTAATLRGRRSVPEQIEGDLGCWFAGSGHSVSEVLAAYESAGRGVDHFDLLLAVSTDHFRTAAHRWALAQLRHAEAVYMYRFSWPSPRDHGRFGAYHYLDTHFAFDLVDEDTTFRPLSSLEVVGDPAPREVAAAYHRAFVDFATTGAPAGATLPCWPRYDDDRRPMMDFGERCELLIDFEAPLMQFWDRARL